MIISKTPVRISLGGGGTDLPSYYEKKEGFLIGGAIDKYVYVSVNKEFFGKYSLKYSKIEKTDNIDNIKHNLIKRTLKFLEIEPGIEITSLADIPARTGMGSSGAFLISLLNSLYGFKGRKPTKRELAEEGCKLEIDIMKEHEGKQDKYVCSMGGLKAYKFYKNGNVSIIPLINEDLIRSTLEENLYLFYTGTLRKEKASDAIKEQDERIKKDESEMLEYMDDIKQIGYQSKKALEDCNFDFFGSLLNKHWIIKKKYSIKSSNKQIDKIYDFALNQGALGGKMIGAPGGGFIMFYFSGKPKEMWKFESSMEEVGLIRIPFKFDIEGVVTL